MNTLSIVLILSWLMGSALGRLMLVVVALWYIDNRYIGLLAALWAPIVRWQKVSALRQAIEINPADVRSMVELGEHYLQGGKFHQAADYLQRAVDRGEHTARALYLYGAAQVKLGRHAEGRRMLTEALAKSPEVAYGEPYLYLLEAAFATEGATSQAIGELVDALRHFDGVEVLTRAGRLCLAAGRKELARDLFEEAVRNYSFVPRRMRRRQRRWAMRARLGLFQAK